MKGVVHATGTDGLHYAIVPAALLERLAPDLARQPQRQADAASPLPPAVVRGLLGGAHPLRAWRRHRGLTLQALADAAGVSKPYVSQIEGGKRTGTAATLQKLAAALGVPVDALVAGAA